jgi:hypothetical protein
MGDFLDTAERLLRQNRVRDAADDFELVLRARDSLQVVHSKAALDVLNIESVFGAFEMGRILGRLGSLETKEIEKLGAAMRVVIATTLEESMAFRGTKDRVLPPHPYDEFVHLVVDTRESEAGDASVITFNYDVGPDYAFHYNTVPVDYSLQDVPPVAGAVAFSKLHGSLSWARCSECDAVQPLNLADYFSRRTWRRDRDEEQALRLAVTQDLGRLKHCGKGCTPEPLIVPPTWNKSQYHNVIESVWRRAAKEMSEAENLVIIGYSLPPTDQFFHHLFALGCVGRRLLRRVIVCDPDGGVVDRFRGLLAPAVQTGLQYFRAVFSASLDGIREELRIPHAGQRNR